MAQLVAGLPCWLVGAAVSLGTGLLCVCPGHSTHSHLERGSSRPLAFADTLVRSVYKPVCRWVCRSVYAKVNIQGASEHIRHPSP